MNRLLLVLVAAIAGRWAQAQPSPTPPKNAPVNSKQAPSSDWKKDGRLTQRKADELCRKELPACRRAFATFWAPPSPCAGRGARCMDVTVQEGSWSCGCDTCTSPSHCKPTEHCASAALNPCSNERSPMECRPGPAPQPREPCPAPPIGPEP